MSERRSRDMLCPTCRGYGWISEEEAPKETVGWLILISMAGGIWFLVGVVVGRLF